MNKRTLTEHQCKGKPLSNSILNSLNNMETCYIEKKKQVELLQTEVARLNDKIAQLVIENVRLKKIIELHHESLEQEHEIENQVCALFVEGE